MAKANNKSLCLLDLPLLPATHSIPLGPTFCHRSHRAIQAFCNRGGQRTSISPQKYDVAQNEETEIRELKIEFYL